MTGLKSKCVPLLSVLIILMSCFVCNAQGWYGGWSYRKAITINAGQVPADLTNFPLLVDITDTDFALYAQTDGDDIVLTAGDGTTLLDYEIESYEAATGHLVAWVKIPTLSVISNTLIYLYCGNASATGLEDPNGVWDSNYVMVQHMEETSGNNYDSTGYLNHGTTVVVTNHDAAGHINGADEFNGSTNYVRVDNAPGLQFGIGSFTAEAWIYPHAAPTTDGVRIVNNRGTGASGLYPGWQLKINGDGTSGTWFVGRSAIDDASGNFKRYDGSTPYPCNLWYHVVMVYQADSELRFYVNGTLDGTLPVGPYGDISNLLPTVIGAALADQGAEGGGPAQAFDGRIDEVRISDIARSFAWIQTSYKNQSDPDLFFTIGVLEQPEPCEGNFNCDYDVDGTDANVFKGDFGRSGFSKRPCTNVDPCDSDFDCDKDVDGSDARTFKLDFGRSQFNNPCPACTTEECIYIP